MPKLPSPHALVIEAAYQIGDTVYLRTDPEQHERLIVGIVIRPGGQLRYEAAHGTQTSWHYAVEFAREPDLVKRTTD